ncbi:MAG: hypothetical protein KDE56_06890 [Anaerolineales bacterium]|nr:hypothetical protein [Anaerolineales bacterium]
MMWVFYAAQHGLQLAGAVAEAGVRRLVIGVGKTAVFPIRTVAGRLGMGDCWEKKQGLLQLPQ